MNLTVKEICIALVLALAVLSGVFGYAQLAYAQSDSWYEPSSSYSDSWYEPSSYSDSWYDSSNYSDSWYEPSSSYSDSWYEPSSYSDSWYEPAYGTNLGYVDVAPTGTNLGYLDIAPTDNNLGYVDIAPTDTNLGYVDIAPNDTNLGYMDIAPNSYYVYGADGVAYSYAPVYASYGYSSGGYSTPFAISAPGYRASYSTGSYPIGRPTSIAHPTSSYRPTSIGSPTSISRPTSIATPTTIAQPVNIAQGVNVAQSVNIAQVATIGQAAPAPVVQYTYPTYSYSYPYNYGYSYPSYNYGGYSYNYPTYNQNVSCSITATPTALTNGQTAFLSWTSSGANRAMLSDGLGYVSPSGSLTVRPESSRNYVLTVWGTNGQTATCNTYVNVSGMVPSVSLTQIPYTGLDLGLFGSLAYWLGLAAFAASAAYLAVYYKGGAFAFATSLVGRSRIEDMKAPRPLAFAPVSAPEVAHTKAPITTRTASLEHLAVLPSVQPTTDSMKIERSEDGSAPRIVINRG